MKITSADVFSIKTHLKLSTLVVIAARIELELRRHPRCTVYERWHQIATCAGHCRTKAEAEAALRADIAAA